MTLLFSFIYYKLLYSMSPPLPGDKQYWWRCW